MEDLLIERADQLKSIGFVLQVTKNSVYYQKGNVKIVSTLIMCASYKEWDEFITKNK